MSGMSLCPALKHRLRSLWHQFFKTIALMEFVLKNPCQQLRSFSLAPCQRSYHVPWPRVWKLWQVLGPQFFGTIVLMKFVSWKAQQQCIFSVAPCQRRYACHDCKPLEKCWAHNFSGESHWWNLSWKPDLSPSYFPRFPLRPPCRRSFPTQLSSTLSSLPSRSFRTELSPSYSPRFPLRPCRRFHLAPSPRTFPEAISHGLHSVIRFHLAPSQRSSPQAISHSFPSVQPVVASISLLPHGALPKLFPTVSFPSTLSSFPYRPFPTELSPSFKLFPTVSFLSTLSALPSRSFPTELSPSIPKLFPMVSFPSPSGRFRIAPSPRSSPQAISHGFPSVQPVVAFISLLPHGALPKQFPTVSPVVASIPLLPQRSSPHAISHGFLSVHLAVASVSLLPHGAFPKLFPTASLPSTLSSLPSRSFPTELFPSYFPRFPLRPPCRRLLPAPSPQSSPQAIISHGFLSVHPVVASIRSLPTDLSPSYFPRFPLRPSSHHFRIAPSRQVQLNENPSIGDAFGKKKQHNSEQTLRNLALTMCQNLMCDCVQATCGDNIHYS